MWVWVVPSDMSYCLTWCGRSDACAMTRGEVIRHPGGVAAVRSPVFRHAGSWRHAGRAWWCPTQIATPEVVAGCRCHHGVACNVLCITGVARRVVWCDDGLPPPPGWHHGAPIGGPRMSPTPRSAKYGVTHGCHHLRGGGNARLRSSSPPLAVMRTLRMLVTWSGAHFKNRNKNPISGSEVTASLRMYPGALPPRGAGHFFATAPLRLAPSTHPQRRALWQYCVFCLHI